MARLVSPVVYSQNSAHCMTFWYHMSGSHVGTLRVKLHYQKPEEYDQLVWMAIGHQGDHWKEGRVLLHKSLKLYQVCPLPFPGWEGNSFRHTEIMLKIMEKRCGNYSKDDFRHFPNLGFRCNLSSIYRSLQHYRNRTNLPRKRRMLLYNLFLAATMNIPFIWCFPQFNILSYKKRVLEV